MYKIFETDVFIKKVKKLFKGKEASRLIEKIHSVIYPKLRMDPYFGSNIRKLKNYKPDTWRYRIGDFRLFYEVDECENTVYITSIDPRKDCY